MGNLIYWDRYLGPPDVPAYRAGWYWMPGDRSTPSSLDANWRGPYTDIHTMHEHAAVGAYPHSITWMPQPTAPTPAVPKPRVVCPACLEDVPPGAGISICWHLPGSQPVDGGVFCGRACAHGYMDRLLTGDLPNSPPLFPGVDVPAPTCQCGGTCGCGPVAPYPHTSASKERG